MRLPLRRQYRRMVLLRCKTVKIIDEAAALPMELHYACHSFLVRAAITVTMMFCIRTTREL